MATQAVRCLYCKGPAKIVDQGDKRMLVCKDCGKKELTKLGISRLLADGK